MKNITDKSWIAIFVLLAFVSGCGNEEKKKDTAVPMAGTNQIQPVDSGSSAADSAKDAVAKQAESNDIVVSVDGNILKKAELEKNIKERLTILQDKIPAGKEQEARENIKKRLMDEFIMRTLLIKEVKKRKIAVSDKEIKSETDKIKTNLPPDKKVDEFLKENKISKEDIALGIKVEKLLKLELGKKAKPTQKEISKFYNDNIDKFFSVPENVHVRHILVTIDKGDDDKVKTEKKDKIENLRKQVLDGADFAEVARKNSDSPNKEKGGDLGNITRGQTVEPFENAAFSQEKNVIGPVVTTEYGYHVIQVLDHNPKKTIALDEVKSKISAHLEQQKKAEAFALIMKKLQGNAKIIIYQN
ncbi:MAG TPA: peptidylprolyl isomerase [Smithellaceae bacterium]